ncbi:MAG TPA: peptidoglycan bridge formation glycyltransferase FemA/FemB family protein [Candidatus Limnocylindria bacterium]|jgi:lipid II:glycine glycyltransferase (peptidoglycan interpeptide bridge formation enzyme)|nr:peptidoglycan bridge formation glycyltransferase FemA/FemB family protein [Candidatus Limnocylindria bacterium]
MRARPATDEEAQNWDRLVQETARPHLLQSTGWARVKAAAGWRPERFILEGDAGRLGCAQVLRKRVAPALDLAYAPRGPLCDDQRLPDAIAALREALARVWTVSFLCDPEAAESDALAAALAARGVGRSPVYVQPRRTLLLDLMKEPEALLAEMRKKTRQYIHKAEREGVVTERTTDLARFHRLLTRVAQRDRFGIHALGYFANLAEAFGEALHVRMARVEGEDVGALLAIHIGERAWELFGGWSGTHAEKRPFYLLKWHSLMQMRQLGVRRYDMWGLAEGKELEGVENFKLGFGGEIATWIGALETPVTGFLFPLWRFGARQRLAAASA